jgi:chorismate mutase
VKPDPDLWGSGSHECLCSAQHTVSKIQQHLFDISRLACQSNNELPQDYLGYKQAYLSERRKLLETVAAYKMQTDAFEKLEQENNYLKHQLIPHYESNVQRQEVTCLEAQVLMQSLEVKLQKLEKVGCDEQEKKTRAFKATTGLENTETREIAALEKDIETCSKSPQIPTLHLRRSSRLRSTVDMQALKRTTRGGKRVQTEAKPKK